MPYFFLSYAHTPSNDAGVADPNIWVRKLYDGLCEHIMELTDLPRGAKVGFMDQGMQVGTKWTDELSMNLALCKVFVPLYSPRYFISEQCGREWWAFSQRQVNQRARGNAPRENAIIPALWVPVEPAQMPQVARDLQFDHAVFGQDYADEGFYGLTKLRYLRDAYERAVYRLAKQIVRVARETDLDEGRISKAYESQPTAFGSWTHPSEFDISVLACTRSELPPGRRPDYYGDRPHDWNPYHPQSTLPLGDYAADLVRTMDYKVNLGALDDNARMLRSSAQAPGILFVDPWVLRIPRYRELLSKIDREAPSSVTVVVPWNRQDPGNHTDGGPGPAELEGVMPRLLRLGRSASRTSVGGVGTLEALPEILLLVVRHVVDEFWENAGKYPPEGPPLVPPRLRGPVLD
ncbi:TIR-like protein FxsC [Streptomyces sp. NPDC001137]|uniref:TIR-like protein FxsC n=1 Tax=Streptomyces sp. NPDC001137 TaxID=3154378 RepID=UPI003316AA7E